MPRSQPGVLGRTRPGVLGRTRRAIATATALLAVSALVSTAPAAAESAGVAHFMRLADSSFDKYTLEPSLGAKQWIDEHMWRMVTYSPYFDSRTSWYPNGWVYRDAYAIYRGSQLASEKPEWILRDSSGNMLYIPFGCSGGTCPQYAGDISNPAFRRYWIEQASAEYAKGYRGVFVDDVNMNMQVGNGNGQLVAPIDRSTGQPMTASAWRGYMATFMQELRSALPGAELVHNVIWFADNHAGISDPSIRSELSAANYVFLERGVNDSGLTGGTGSWSVSALLSYVDEVHSLGRGIVLDGTSSEPAGLEYNLAAYFLVSNGGDAVSGGGQTPEHWWTGWSVNLGEATGPRYTWNNLLRRDFSGGMALLNPPGAATATVSLPAPMEDVNGNTVTSVTLGAGSGAVLRGAATTSSSAASATTGETTTSTQTIVEATTTPSSSETTSSTTGTTSPTGAGSTSSETTTGSPHGKGATKKAHSAVIVRRHGPGGHRASHRRHARHAHRGRRRASSRWSLARVSGRVLPAASGEVTVELYQRHGRRWTFLRSVRIAIAARGRFARLLHLRRGGRYRVRAVYGGASGFAPSRSAYRVIVLSGR